jgi:hypothetical protein
MIYKNKTKLRLNLILLCLLFSGFIIISKSQVISLRVNSGINFFNMTQLKTLQNQLNDSGLDTKIVDNFPSYYNYQVQLVHTFPVVETVGIYFDFVSTGGRIDYEDYSGIYRRDQLVSRSSVGILCERKFYDINNFAVYAGGKVSVQFSKLKFNDLLQIFNYTNTISTEFNSNGIGIEPDLNFEYNYSPFLFRLEFAYQFSFSGSFNNENNGKLVLRDGENTEIKPQWDGFKIGVIFGINI